MRAAVVLVALLVLLAGCSGAPTGGGGGAGDATPTAAAAGSSGTSGADDSTPDAGGEWARFTFEEGEFYRYAVLDRANDREAEVTWEVLAVEEGELTAEFTYIADGRSVSRTVTGDKSTVAFQLVQSATTGSDEAEIEAATRAATYLSLGPFNPTTALFTSRDLAVGNRWELTGSPGVGYVTAAVEGRDSYAGTDCFVSTIRVPDTDEWADSTFSDFELCVAPDLGLALYSAYYERGADEPLFEVSLVEHRA
jgi:YD repeat-containing protein